jgi:hypothetical protein
VRRVEDALQGKATYTVNKVTPGEEYTLWNSSLCNSVQPPVTFFPSDSNVLLSTLFSTTASLSLHSKWSMESGPSWEAGICLATQEISSILRNWKVHCLVHKSPELLYNPSQMNPVHIRQFHSFKNNFSTSLPPTSRSLYLSLSFSIYYNKSAHRSFNLLCLLYPILEDCFI